MDLDITALEEAQKTLAERTRYAEAVIDASPDQITVFDKEKRIIAWNRKCEEAVGVKREDAIGKTISEIFPLVDGDAEFTDAQERAIGGEQVYLPQKKGFFTKGHSEWFYIPLQDERGETYAVLNVIHDVSDAVSQKKELKFLNSTLSQKNRELEQKNEDIMSFAFVASHDLKEPLRKIHTFSDWLLEKEAPNLSTGAQDYLNRICASAKRMDLLVEDILVLTKIHADKRGNKEVALDHLLSQVKHDLAAYITKIDAVISAQALPVIKGNVNQLFHLFRNIIQNAIHFASPGVPPHIDITSSVVPGDELPLRGIDTAYTRISFKDNGIGFDQKYHRKVFQVFQQLQDRQKGSGGTGMGLAICKKIVENHGGFITVESAIGAGSVFHCFFPAE